MRNVGMLLAVSGVTALASAVGCSSKPSSPGTGGGAASSSQASSSSSSSSASAGGGGAGGDAGGPALDCTVPAIPPSMGSCVAFTSDAGTELDAGLDDAGYAAITTCNPLTNEGCTGADVCGPDPGASFYCHPAGTTPDVPICGDCTAPGATCATGGYCGEGAGGSLTCYPMCCTDADCGSGKCETGFVLPPFGDNVGVCVVE